MKTNLSQVYLAQATQCQEVASRAVLANVREKNERAEASWRAMAVRELDREAERPAQRADDAPRSVRLASPPEPAETKAETVEEFDGFDLYLVNVGMLIDWKTTDPKVQKNPQTPVNQAFGIDSRNLYRSNEIDELEEPAESAE